MNGLPAFGFGEVDGRGGEEHEGVVDDLDVVSFGGYSRTLRLALLMIDGNVERGLGSGSKPFARAVSV